MDDEGPDEPLLRSVVRAGEVSSAIDEYLELGLDALIDNELLDALPIVGTVKAGVSALRSIRDRMLMKKLAAFLQGAMPRSESERVRWLAKIASDRDRRATGERLLMIIERAVSVQKAMYVGWVFRQYLEGRCDAPTFRRSIEMIDNALTEDLEALVSAREARRDDHQAVVELDLAVASRLGSVGLVQPFTGSIRPVTNETVIYPEGLLLVRPPRS